MNNYKDLENLEIMKEAAQNSGVWWDAFGAGIWMAMWANMAQNMQNSNSSKDESSEEKLLKLKNLLDKWLISNEDYEAKKKEILSNF